MRRFQFKELTELEAWNPLSVDEVALGQLNSSRYLNSQAPGIGQSFSPGYWQIWYVAG